MNPRKLIRRRAVLDMTGLTYVTQWRLESRGAFPARVRLNPTDTRPCAAVAWHEDEVIRWVHDRVRVGSGIAPRPDIAK